MAQSITGTSLASTWSAAARRVKVTLEMQWSGSAWTDESANLRSFDVQAGLIDETTRIPALGQAKPATCSLTLYNAAQRYSPQYSASPLHAAIANGFQRVPVRLGVQLYSGSAWEPTTPMRRFTGYVESAEWLRSGGEAPDSTLLLNCVDNTLKLDQHKTNSGLLVNKRADELIDALLDAAGIADEARDLDAGLHIIPWAWFDRENLFTECVRLAQADGGMFYFSPTGTAIYHNAVALLNRAHSQTAQAEFSPSELFTLAGAGGWRDTYTGVSLVYIPRQRGQLDTVYQALETIELAPGEERDVVCQLDVPAYGIVKPVANTHFEAVNAGNADMSASLTLTIPTATVYAQRFTVHLVNGHATQRMYLTNFTVAGWPLEGAEAHDVERDAEDAVLTAYWRSAPADTKRYTLPENPFLQTRGQGEALANALRDRLQYPRQVLQFDAAACPFLELCDRVSVTDPTSGLDQEAYLLAYAERYETGDLYRATYTVLPVENVFGHDAYFMLGTDSWGASTPPLYY